MVNNSWMSVKSWMQHLWGKNVMEKKWNCFNSHGTPNCFLDFTKKNTTFFLLTQVSWKQSAHLAFIHLGFSLACIASLKKLINGLLDLWSVFKCKCFARSLAHSLQPLNRCPKSPQFCSVTLWSKSQILRLKNEPSACPFQRLAAATHNRYRNSGTNILDTHLIKDLSSSNCGVKKPDIFINILPSCYMRLGVRFTKPSVINQKESETKHNNTWTVACSVLFTFSYIYFISLSIMPWRPEKLSQVDVTIRKGKELWSYAVCGEETLGLL